MKHTINVVRSLSEARRTPGTRCSHYLGPCTNERTEAPGERLTQRKNRPALPRFWKGTRLAGSSEGVAADALPPARTCAEAGSVSVRFSERSGGSAVKIVLFFLPCVAYVAGLVPLARAAQDSGAEVVVVCDELQKVVGDLPARDLPPGDGRPAHVLRRSDGRGHGLHDRRARPDLLTELVVLCTSTEVATSFAPTVTNHGGRADRHGRRRDARLRGAPGVRARRRALSVGGRQPEHPGDGAPTDEMRATGRELDLDPAAELASLQQWQGWLDSGHPALQNEVVVARRRAPGLGSVLLTPGSRSKLFVPLGTVVHDPDLPHEAVRSVVASCDDPMVTSGSHCPTFARATPNVCTWCRSRRSPAYSSRSTWSSARGSGTTLAALAQATASCFFPSSRTSRGSRLSVPGSCWGRRAYRQLSRPSARARLFVNEPSGRCSAGHPSCADAWLVIRLVELVGARTDG